jgi:hypothetical protein
MNEPWLADAYAWIPGTLLGCLAGLWGGLAGTLAPRGKARTLVLGIYWVLLIASILLLIGGVAAWLGDQSYGTWYGLGLPGLLGVLILGINGPLIFRVYRQAEQRRLEAQDLV